jgi:hypothetical protein
VSTSTAGGNVSITQQDVAGNAVGDTASVSTDTVGGSVTITQGAGSGDTALVLTDTVGGSVTILQGAGSGDTATVSATNVGGSVTITQQDVAGNASGDTATVSNGTIVGHITIGGNITITQGNASGDVATISGVTATGGSATSPVTISITQGSGSGDTATISSVTAPNGNVSITQHDVANVPGDTASVLNVTTGTQSPDGEDFNGNVTITQGNAAGDVALVQGGSSNNVTITQGDNVQNPDGSTVATDIAEINNTSVFSDITIIQGTGASAGLYVAAIAFDYLNGHSGPVTASATEIDQQGANNQVFLGDGDSPFTTFYLDVFTGSGGGAFVMATNTTVSFGPLGLFLTPYTVTGGLTNNSYFDGGGNFGVTFDPAHFTQLF